MTAKAMPDVSDRCEAPRLDTAAERFFSISELRTHTFRHASLGVLAQLARTNQSILREVVPYLYEKYSLADYAKTYPTHGLAGHVDGVSSIKHEDTRSITLTNELQPRQRLYCEDVRILTIPELPFEATPLLHSLGGNPRVYSEIDIWALGPDGEQTGDRPEWGFDYRILISHLLRVFPSLRHFTICPCRYRGRRTIWASIKLVYAEDELHQHLAYIVEVIAELDRASFVRRILPFAGPNVLRHLLRKAITRDHHFDHDVVAADFVTSSAPERLKHAVFRWDRRGPRWRPVQVAPFLTGWSKQTISESPISLHVFCVLPNDMRAFLQLLSDPALGYFDEISLTHGGDSQDAGVEDENVSRKKEADDHALTMILEPPLILPQLRQGQTLTLESISTSAFPPWPSAVPLSGSTFTSDNITFSICVGFDPSGLANNAYMIYRCLPDCLHPILRYLHFYGDQFAQVRICVAPPMRRLHR